LFDASQIVNAFPREPWPHQLRGVEGLLRKLKHVDSAVLCSPTGCHERDHPILMFDGTIKPVQDVAVGDMLMGPDSTPRTVMRLCRGVDEMYRITPLRGQPPFIVNGDHVLSLRHARETARGLEYSIKNITVKEYLATNKYFKHMSKLQQCGVDFRGEDPEWEIPPYHLGALLGDGCLSNGSVILVKPEEVMHNAMRELATMHGLRATSKGKECSVASIKRKGVKRHNVLSTWLREAGLGTTCGHKFVPHEYKTASREARLQILAGILDTGGSLHNNCYDFISKSERLSRDVAYIARSLGMRAHVAQCEKWSQNGTGGVYWRVSISGNTAEIPCRIERKKASPRLQKKDVSVSGFSVEHVGVGEYFGFTLDGDHLYLDGEFTRHHNSGKGLIQTALTNLFLQAGEGVVLYNLRRSLTDQTIERLDDDDMHFGVRSAAHKHLQNLNARVQVASLQTDVARILRQQSWEPHDCKLVLIDEAHLAMGPEYVKLIQLYLSRGAKVVGVTGTPVGMSSVYKDIVVAGTNSEMRACKAHVKAIVYAPHEMDLSKIKTVKTGEYRDGDIVKHCWSQAIVGHIYDDYRKINPEGRLTMATAPGISESVWLSNQFLEKGHRVLHIDYKRIIANGVEYKNDPKGEVRQQALKDFRKGEYDILCNCETIQQGVDIPELGHLILARPYGSLANCVQTYGRVIRYSPQTPDMVTVQDHGGNWHRHSSPNADRDWAELFTMSEKEIAEKKTKEHHEEKKEEPITCGECGMVRASGGLCPKCGTKGNSSVRTIVQQNGDLRRVEGKVYPRPEGKPIKSVEQKNWDSIFWAARNSKSPRAMTFSQAKAYYEHKYKSSLPAELLKRVPIDPIDYSRRVRDVEWKELK
jgi:superfamily II DNA or RNA helicase